MNDLVGKTLDRYRIVAQIGRGGMATVYKAYQAGLDRYVAIKVLPPYHAQEPGFLERFKQEARAVAQLRHPNILTVHDFGEEGSLTYIVMEFVEGGTLKQRLRRPLALDTALALAIQVGEALDYAHGEGIIHRDVKPGNVLLPREDWALLSDFGIAKIVASTAGLTKTGVGIGTPEYMSPEQGQGLPLDSRSDVYALGVMLYEMVTGCVPFSADTPFAVVMKHVNEPLPLPSQVKPDVPEPLERLILKAMAKDPGDRYRTAGEMVRALKAVRAGLRAAPARPSAPPVAAPSRAGRRGFNLLWLVVPVLIALLAGGGFLAWSGLRPALGPEPAPTEAPAEVTLTPLPAPTSTLAPTSSPTPPPRPAVRVSEDTFHTNVYNANTPYSVLIEDLDDDGARELIVVGALTDYALIPSPNPRCEWCNEWRLDAYDWDGERLTLDGTGILDVGYDTWVRGTVGTIGGATKVIGVGHLYPCGSARSHAGMAVFNAALQHEHYHWGDRRSTDPCLHDYASFTSVVIADLDGDGAEEIVAGGSGDSTGGEDTYREWLLTIRASDGVDFHEQFYEHFDHGEGAERLTDLAVADVDGDGTQEIVATGYGQEADGPHTVLQIMTWDGAALTTEHVTGLGVGSEDNLHRLALGDVDGDGRQEIVLAGWADVIGSRDWYVKVVRWDGSRLSEMAERTWATDDGAAIESVDIHDADQDGQAEILLAGNVNGEDVPGASAGYGYIHRYADWRLKVMSLREGTWTEEVTREWTSSRDYDTNGSGGPDPDDAGALGRLSDADVGDLDGDGQVEVALVGEWVWAGWHVKVLSVPASDE